MFGIQNYEVLLGEIKEDLKNPNETKELNSQEIANQKLKQHFDAIADRHQTMEANNNDKQDIEAMISNAKIAAKNYSGKKPSLGLESPVINQAEQEFASTENETKANNLDAKNNLNATQNNAELENNKAEQMLTQTKSSSNTNNKKAEETTINTENEANDNNQAAQDNLTTVETEAQDKIQNAQEEVSRATDSTEQANSDLTTAQGEVATAQNNLATAKAELSSAETEEDKNAINQKIKQAEEALKAAQEKESSAKTAQENANKALEEAKQNENKTKEETDNAISEAKENVETVSKQGEEDVSAAKENQEVVKNEGIQNVQNAENDKAQTFADGQNAIAQANKNVSAVQIDGEKNINDAQKNIDNAIDTTGEDLRTKAIKERIAEADKIAEGINKAISGVGCNIDDLRTNLHSIDTTNVVDVLDSYEILTEDNLDKETLTEAICDETRMLDENKKYALNHIGNQLKTQAKQLGIDTSELDSQLDKTIENAIDSSTFGYVSNDKIGEIDNLFNKYTNAINKEEVARMNDLNSATDSKKAMSRDYTLKMNNAIKEIYSEDNTGVIPITNDYLGNGSFDNPSKQNTENCWLHGAINAMTATDKGTGIVNNLVREKNGNISVLIPEARNNGNENKGIYVYNSKEMLDNLLDHSVGDGDMAAYSKACDEYLKSTGKKDGVDWGMNYRGFELISGLEAKHIISEGVLPKGVNCDDEVSNNDYSNMQTELSNGRGAFVTGFDSDKLQNIKNATLVDHNYKPVSGEPFISDRHTYAVKKVENDYIYLQESENPMTYIKLPKDEYLESCGVNSSYIF